VIEKPLISGFFDKTDSVVVQEKAGPSRLRRRSGYARDDVLTLLKR